jgi:hypothetical protein
MNGEVLGALFCLVCVFAPLFGIVGGLIGREKGRAAEGVLLGFAFGLIGCLIVALLPSVLPPRKPAYRCFYCLGELPGMPVTEVTKCLYCGSDLSRRPSAPVPPPLPRPEAAPAPALERWKPPAVEQAEWSEDYIAEAFLASDTVVGRGTGRRQMTWKGCGYTGTVSDALGGRTVRRPKCRARIKA